MAAQRAGVGARHRRAPLAPDADLQHVGAVATLIAVLALGAALSRWIDERGVDLVAGQRQDLPRRHRRADLAAGAGANRLQAAVGVAGAELSGGAADVVERRGAGAREAERARQVAALDLARVARFGHAE